MDRRTFVVSALAALPAFSRAQPAQPRRIGVLWAGSEKAMRDYLLPGLRKALATAGVIERRHFELDVEPAGSGGLHAAATRLAARKPDVVLVQGIAATRAMIAAAPQAAIVTSVADPVAAGFARSLAKPGGNVTGIALGAPEVPKKALEMVARLVPLRSRVAVACRDTAPDQAFAARVQQSIEELGLVSERVVVPAAQMGQAFASLDRKRTPAVVLASYVEPEEQRSLARDALRKSVAAVSLEDAGTEPGFLLSVNARQDDYFQQSAALLARIINGARPADTAFERLAGHDVVLNRATARALKLSIPSDVQMRADRVTS